MEREALLVGDVQPGGRAPAPAPLRLVQAFVNTVDREHGPDLLDHEEGLREWLTRRGLHAEEVAPAELARAREVREALREVLWSHGSGEAEPLAVARLDAAAERARLRPRFATGSLEPAADGVDGALGSVLAAAFAARAEGTFVRLKACPGDRCGWAFYDRSPTASATWCSMRVCGGRAKARDYYRRRRG